MFVDRCLSISWISSVKNISITFLFNHSFNMPKKGGATLQWTTIAPQNTSWERLIFLLWKVHPQFLTARTWNDAFQVRNFFFPRVGFQVNHVNFLELVGSLHMGFFKWFFDTMRRWWLTTNIHQACQDLPGIPAVSLQKSLDFGLKSILKKNRNGKILFCFSVHCMGITFSAKDEFHHYPGISWKIGFWLQTNKRASSANSNRGQP